MASAREALAPLLRLRHWFGWPEDPKGRRLFHEKARSIIATIRGGSAREVPDEIVRAADAMIERGFSPDEIDRNTPLMLALSYLYLAWAHASPVSMVAEELAKAQADGDFVLEALLSGAL